MKFCQSCGMPLQAEDQWGTNADGSLNEEYCCYCYQKGAFTQDYTMEEMIGHCLQFLDEFNREADVPRTREQALAEMRQFFPALLDVCFYYRWCACLPVRMRPGKILP